MFILNEILARLKEEFTPSREGHERCSWFISTILTILVPFTSSKTSNILRCLNTLFGYAGIGKKRFYTFMVFTQDPLATAVDKAVANDSRPLDRWPSATGPR